ncbi:TrmB family transcriptional regulator [Halobacteria archaeon AArc-curdl1]|uniref:TrmB family transcriptional regulator n=1 Tax=Natronosalvus hydrolyticus TaxID=2979988 RepID=A0AAP3E7J2_9EURY|nr:TrmB family transcriptional regulator [Halobacteria archaeon AArc-curdl1]
MDADYVDELTSLGLSSYEARAYVALVENGVMTADDVATEADVPLGRIYDVLNSLDDRSLIRSDDGRPRTYTHVQPSVAIDRLLERRTTELETKRSAYEQTASNARQTLTELDEREAVDQFATSAFHDEAARDLLLERFESANHSIRILVDDIELGPDIRDSIVKRLDERARADCDVQLLGAELADDTGKLQQLIDAGVRVRQADVVPAERFIVIDETEVCLEMQNPIHAEELLAVVNFRDETIAKDLGSSFDEIWRRSGPMNAI